MGAPASGALRVAVHAGVPPGAGPADSAIARRREFLRRPRNPTVPRAGRTDRLPLLHPGRPGDGGLQPQRLAAKHRRHRQCPGQRVGDEDRKSTRLNSSHDQISYAVFCLKKKKKKKEDLNLLKKKKKKKTKKRQKTKK